MKTMEELYANSENVSWDTVYDMNNKASRYVYNKNYPMLAYRPLATENERFTVHRYYRKKDGKKLTGFCQMREYRTGQTFTTMEETLVFILTNLQDEILEDRESREDEMEIQLNSALLEDNQMLKKELRVALADLAELKKEKGCKTMSEYKELEEKWRGALGNIRDLERRMKGSGL